MSTKHDNSERTREQHNLAWAIDAGSTQLTSKPTETEVENVSDADTIDYNGSVDTVLSLEKARHKYKASLRMKLFQKILSNESIELELTKFVLYILITILVSAAPPLVFMLIPAHNLIVDPGYWYELLYQSIPWCIGLGIYTAFVLGYYSNID
jgi:hypothetical protein